MPHRPLQNVVQEKGHRDLISDEGHITKGGDGAAKFESGANGIRRHLVPAMPCATSFQETERPGGSAALAVWVFVEASVASCLSRHAVGTTTLDLPVKRRSTHGKLLCAASVERARTSCASCYTSLFVIARAEIHESWWHQGPILGRDQEMSTNCCRDKRRG